MEAAAGRCELDAEADAAALVEPVTVQSRKASTFADVNRGRSARP